MRTHPPDAAQRGAANIRFIVTLAIFAVIGYLCFKLVPPYVNNYQLQDTVDSESRFYAARTKNEEAVRKDVWAQMQSLGITAQRDNMKVQIMGHTAQVSVDYTVTVDLPGYPLNLEFHTKGESPMF